MKSFSQLPPLDGFRFKAAQAGAVLLLGMFGSSAYAANYAVSSGTASFDCSNVNPGDTVTLAAGTRGPLKITDCKGSASSRIVIRNDVNGSSPTILQKSDGASGGFVLQCYNCNYVVIDGTDKWNGAPSGRTYGIKATQSGSGGPTAFVKILGRSSFVTIRGVEVDGKWPSLAKDGIGIDVNDHAIDAASNPGVWREGFLIEYNYVHNTEGEGVYVGPNYPQGDLPLRNIEIRNNLVEDTGWDGINLKMAVQGANSIHHNVIRRAGSKTDGTAGQHYGIGFYESNGKIYSNWVENSGETAISHYMQYLPMSYGAQASEIYNNVVIKPGRTGPLAGNGITPGNSSGAAAAAPKIYNNTIVGAEGSGIKVGSDSPSGFIRDNIVVDSIGGAVSAPGSVPQTNNLVGTSAKAMFVDAARLDFRLQAASPARNSGSSSFPATDYDGIARPQDSAADVGAFEFHLSDVQPMPPDNLSVQ